MAGTAYDNSANAKVSGMGPELWFVKSTFVSSHVWVQGDSIKMFNIPARCYILSWDLTAPAFGAAGGATTTIQIGDTANAVDHFMKSAAADATHTMWTSRNNDPGNAGFTIYNAADSFIITLNSLESTGLGVASTVYAWSLYTSNQG